MRSSACPVTWTATSATWTPPSSSATTRSPSWWTPAGPTWPTSEPFWSGSPSFGRATPRQGAPTRRSASRTSSTDRCSGSATPWEGYPDLKASENFLQVQGRISELETVINDRRELINASVTDHNTLIAQFPALLVARALNFMERPLLRIPEADKQDNLKPFTGA